jgi:MFS family permease
MRSLPPSCRALAVIVTLAFLANGVAAPYWVVYALDHIGLSASAWGAILLVEMLVRNAFAIPAGIAVDRHGRAPFIRGALLITAMAVPLFALATAFVHVLLIRILIGIANAFFLPACSAMMADTVPRDMRGRAMAALGRGTVLLGASSGGTGGPGLGFLITIPVMVGSLLGGYLYSLSPLASWLCALGATGIALVVAVTALDDVACAEV